MYKLLSHAKFAVTVKLPVTVAAPFVQPKNVIVEPAIVFAVAVIVVPLIVSTFPSALNTVPQGTFTLVELTVPYALLLTVIVTV